MKMAFHKSECSYLSTVLQEVQNAEQSQEIRLTDDYPDAGRILGAWGQFIARGKEWRSDSVHLTGGLMVWVLYAPEDGSRLRVAETWIPYQVKWPLPEGTPEGKLCVQAYPRFVDARIVTPRKLMIRGGIGACMQVLSPARKEVYILEEAGDLVELLHRRYPVRLVRESGEKTFQLEEELTLDSPAEKLVCYTMSPEITDKKVLSDKIAIRGNGNLHVLYGDADGKLTGKDYLLSFSQFEEMARSYSSDAQTDVRLLVTNLEAEIVEGNTLRVRCGLAAQYLTDDISMIETVEDAYSPGRQLTMEREQLCVSEILEKKTEILRQDQEVPGQGTEVLDFRLMVDCPKQYRENGQLELEIPGTMQLLYSGLDGSVQCANARWEGKLSLPAAQDVSVYAFPGVMAEPQIHMNGDSITVHTEVPISMTASGGSGIPMVTGLEQGEEQEPDAGRPSLILRRCNGQSLWEIAKQCGSTVSAIRTANGLQEEPNPKQMLLIPVR